MKNFTWKSVMNHRNLIYGFAAIWIMIYHIYLRYYWPSIPVVSQVIRIGNMGVDIFVFLSAIGLSFSIEKNTTKEFYINRIKRVFVPFLLMALPFYIWDSIALYGLSAKAFLEFLLNITTISFWCREGAPAWYMAFVLVMYTLFPLLYKLKKKHKYILVLLILLSIATELLLKFIESPVYIFGERVLSRIPIFLVGMFIADYVKENRKVSKLFAAVVIATAVAGFILISLYNVDVVLTRYLYAFMSIAVVLVVSFVVDKIQDASALRPIIKSLSFCGVISLEIYLIHTYMLKFLGFYNLLFLTYNAVYYVMVSALSIVLGVLVNKIASYIIKPKKANI